MSSPRYSLAARTCSGQLAPGSPTNFLRLNSYVCGSLGPVRTVEDFKNRADSAATAKAWGVYLIQVIDNDGGCSPISAATLQGSLDYLSANPEKFQVEAFGNVARYIRERNAASVAEISSRADSLTIRVTDGLDDSVYNYPLTLRRPRPRNWPGAAVSHNGRAVSTRIVTVGSVKRVMFAVIPDGGDVILSKP